MKSVFPLLGLICLLQIMLFPAAGVEPGGQWKAPAADGSPWKHAGTGLTFPQRLGDYRLAGEFTYTAGGVFVRYENTEARARADIFLFPSPVKAEKAEDKHRLLLKEMDTVVADLQSMVKQGRYKNIQFAEPVGKEIPLWLKEPLPIVIRTLTATRIGNSARGEQEAQIKQWIGITVVEGHVLTIRHLRPLDTGDQGEQDMQGFVGAIYQIIKDPPLRQEIKRLVDAYHADPFTPDSEQAAAAVLAYLQQNPLLPIHVPEHPISAWLERCKAQAPGTEDHLLRAFMLGGAKAAFDGADAATCVNEGARQFARVYRHLVQKHPLIALPDMQPFITAAEKGEGAVWLREHG
ncbi:MAG: hypothetical protein U0984_03165 [Prosthecobacter sp.]|nr:hypothetical protein [Prosthecobacter sp.]